MLMLVCAVFAPALRCGYIWDDDDYLTHNPVLREPGGLWRIWADRSASPQYYPLVFSTFWVELRLWGDDAAGYHAVNIALHAVSAVLLFLILRTLGVPFAWLCATVFGIHPVQVESVVWITERKNVLSGCFYFLAMLAYLRHALKASPPRSKWLSGYALALGCLFLALLSKTTAATLPVTLGVILIWKRGRLTRSDVLGLAPMFVMGLAMGLHTAWLERHHVGAEGEQWSMALTDRLHVAMRAPVFYAAKLCFPAPLCFIYERWDTGIGLGSRVALFLLFATIPLVIGMKARRPAATLVAMACFGIALAPALGFFNVYPFVYSFVADHFQYLGTAPLIALIVPWMMRGLERPPHRIPALHLPFAILILAALAAGTISHIPPYQSAETLWAENIRRNPRGAIAYNNLGAIYLGEGETELAVAVLAAGANQLPENDSVLGNLGGALIQAGRVDEAMVVLGKAQSLNPKSLLVKTNLSWAAVTQGRYEDAVKLSEEVIKTDPKVIMAYNNLAAAQFHLGRSDLAVATLRNGLTIDPENVMLQSNLDQIEPTLRK